MRIFLLGLSCCLTAATPACSGMCGDGTECDGETNLCERSIPCSDDDVVLEEDGDMTYSVALNKHCGGDNIKPLDENTPYPYDGTVQECKQKCWQASGCMAFVWRSSDEKCFWKSGTVNANTLSSKEGLTCYSTADLTASVNKPVELDFVLGDEEDADCKNLELATREQCQAYGIYNDLRFNEVNQGNRPSGCYFQTGTNLVRFNTEASGKGKKGIRPVCVRDGEVGDNDSDEIAVKFEHEGYKGKTFGDKRKESINECSKACLNESSCKGISYHMEKEYCFFLKSLDKKSANDNYIAFSVQSC